LRKVLEADERYCKVRYLDPGNPKSGRKRFYNPDIPPGFDDQYTLRA
jgi:hypothetical protein